MLKDILTRVARDTGIGSYSDATKRAFLLDLVNRALRDINNTHVLPGMVEEIQITLPSSGFVTLPYYVSSVLAVLPNDYKDSRFPVVDAYQKYSKVRSSVAKRRNFRVVGEGVFATMPSTNSTLKFVLPAAESASFTITVEGSTPQASHKLETVTMPAGTLEVETTNQWMINGPRKVTSIVKSARTSSDVTIMSGDVIVGMIANRMLRARTLVVEIFDTQLFGSSGIDVLYKATLQPVSEDNETILGELFEEAVYWKCIEFHLAPRAGEESKAIAAMQRCSVVLNGYINQYNTTSEQEVASSRNPFRDMVYNYGI